MKKIQLMFTEPTVGYWDSGNKDGGIFEPDLKDITDLRPGDSIKWGCWGLNFWFRCKTGKTYQTALSYAVKKIKRIVKVPCTVTVIE